MGVINPGEGKILFLNVSKGYLVNKTENISAIAYSGHIVGIERKEDEFENKKIWKVRVTMVDEKGEKAVITFTEKSHYALGFFSRVKKLDFNKEITLGVGGSEQNDKISFCWMKNGGEKIPRDPEFIKPTEYVPDEGAEPIKVWKEVIAVFISLIDYINAELHKIKQAADGPGTTGSKEESTAPDDDLPF